MTVKPINQWIQVHGHKSFPENKWRLAIVYFLNGIWSNDAFVMQKPKINFNGYTLRLNLKTDLYYVYGKCNSAGEKTSTLCHLTTGRTLKISADKVEVEVGLMRFVKDTGISELVISFPRSAKLTLRKTTKAGEYLVDGGVGGKPLPALQDAETFYGL